MFHKLTSTSSLPPPSAAWTGSSTSIKMSRRLNNSLHTCTCGSVQEVDCFTLVADSSTSKPAATLTIRDQRRLVSAALYQPFMNFFSRCCALPSTLLCVTNNFRPVMTVISLWDQLEATLESQDVNNTFLFLVCDTQSCNCPYRLQDLLPLFRIFKVL